MRTSPAPHVASRRAGAVEHVRLGSRRLRRLTFVGHSGYSMGRSSQSERSRRVPEPSVGLAEAVADAIDILRGRPACGGEGRDDRERMVAIIAENDSLPNSEVTRMRGRSMKPIVAGRRRSAARSGARRRAA